MGATWTRLEVAGKPADVFDPVPGPPRFGLVYLHGVSQETLADKSTYTRLFDEIRLGCICPAGDQSWWSDRTCLGYDAARTAERYILHDVLPFVRQRWNLPERSVGLFGISMGGQGALRIAFKHPDVFPVVAGIAPAIDHHEYYGQGTPLDTMYDSKEQCRQDTTPLHVHPAHQPRHIFFCCDPDDSWSRGNDRLHEKLSALGVPHGCDLTTRAGGHTWDYYNVVAERVVHHLSSGLEQESRRLL
jgi:S-formylglutathione hydrolase FrmB